MNVRLNAAIAASLLLVVIVGALFLMRDNHSGSVEIQKGWVTHNQKAIWGMGQMNGIWKPSDGPNLARHSNGAVGPNQTEDLNALTDAMIKYGYMAFEHNYGLWYDRRRDKHDIECRSDPYVVPPFLEQPWARSETVGACDGLTKYDLENFNGWYFERLREFAKLGDQKGIILHHNYYMQHALLEVQPHYVDFPWRPVNTIQDTEMPDEIPAANTFYDIKHATRRRLHRLYIRKVLDEIGEFKNIFHFPSQEYTGNAEFARFWMDTIVEWENEKSGRDIKIGIGATKDVLDELLNDPVREPHIDVIDLRYFWIKKSGAIFAPVGGEEYPGRLFYGKGIVRKSSPQKIYEQTILYRLLYPNKVITHAVSTHITRYLAFLMAGGSINYALSKSISDGPVQEYAIPIGHSHLQLLNQFLAGNITAELQSMAVDLGNSNPAKNVFALSNERALLIYSISGEPLPVTLPLGDYVGVWYGPHSNNLVSIEKRIKGKRNIILQPPSTDEDWLLWLKQGR